MTLGDSLAGSLCHHHHWAPYGQCSGCDKPFRVCLGEEIQRTIDCVVRDARAEALEEAAKRLENDGDSELRAVAPMLREWAKEAKNG